MMDYKLRLINLLERLTAGVFKKDYIIGLDIGSSSIKLAQFARDKDGLHLIRAGIEEIPSDIEEPSRERAIISILKNLLQGIDIKKAKFIVSANCPKTLLRIVTAPYMPKEELAEGIKIEAKNYFPFPVDGALLDFEILGEVIEKEVKKYRLAVATSPKETVDEYISLLNKVDIKPHSFIPSSYALVKLIETSYLKKGEEINSFIDIGERQAELVIFKGEKLVFYRKIPVGGRNFTEAMTHALLTERGKKQLSQEEAERIKRQVGILAEGESKLIEDKVSTSQILSMLMSPLEQLANEISRCFDYFREEFWDSRIDSLVMLGGGASLSGLPKFLSERLGIEVKVGIPPEAFKVESGAMETCGKDKQPLNQLATAVGLALSEAKGINLLAGEFKEEIKRKFRRLILLVLVATVIPLSAFIYISMRMQHNILQKKNALAVTELASLQPQLKTALTQSLANTVLAQEPLWEDIFKELSNVIPDGAYLTGLTIAKDKAITLKGIIIKEDGVGLLSAFMLTLEKGIFKDVRLITTRDLKDKKGSEFEIKCRVD